MSHHPRRDVISGYYSDKIYGSCKGFREGILSLLRSHNVRASKLLDAGGGDGSFTLSIAKAVEAKEVWIVDVSELALQRAKQRGINVVRADLSIE